MDIKDTDKKIQTNNNNMESLNVHIPTPIIRPEYGQTKRDALPKDYEMWLRVATIDNPNYNRLSPIGSNPLDTNDVVNENTGRVCLRWEGLNYGLVNTGGKGTPEQKDFSYNPEDRSIDEQANISDKEPVELTYPFIWSGPANWCGINYLPPVGAKVIVGFAKNNKPMILGYLYENYKMSDPPLRTGEIMIKGYGKNYIHNRWSNKLDLVTKAEEGEQDRDDSSGSKSAKSSCVAQIRLDADNGFIELMVNGTGIRISEDGISFSVQGKSSMTMEDDAISNVTSGAFKVNASTVNMNYGRGDSN